ncbi:MAG: protein kinase, partial [Chloroflexota bacterium]
MSSTDLTGLQIKQYRLDKLLGEGGMGRVYQAYDTNLERKVAIKLMHGQLAAVTEFRERLKMEALAAAQLEHPSIVRVYDFGDSDHGLYIAMEYVAGGTLRAHLKRLQGLNRLLPIDQALQIVIQIAEALTYAHGTRSNNRFSDMVHRDVKPGNIILKRLPEVEKREKYPFRAVLTDFGLVKVSESSLKTQTGFTVGTPIYMSPEQCQGAPLDGRSDFYSLGVVFYELLTNELPFAFKSLSEALSTHMQGHMPDPPSSKRAEIPPLINTIVMKMLAKRPVDRFENGESVVRALRSASNSLQENPTLAVPRIPRDPPSGQPIRDKGAEVSSENPLTTYALYIEAENQVPSQVPLSKELVTIGRSPDNDIVLSEDGVSRYHTRLLIEDSQWKVVDLGGMNGTYLNGQRLRPHQSTPIDLNDQLEIEKYSFRLLNRLDDSRFETQDEVETEAPLRSQSVTAPQPPATGPLSGRQSVQSEPRLPRSDDPLDIFVADDTLTAQPGQSIKLNVEVVNRTFVADRVSLKVLGLPDSWVSTPDTFTDLPAEGRTTIPVTIKAPRSPETPIGRQRFRVRLISQEYKDHKVAIQANLMLVGFSDFAATLENSAITLPGNALVNIQNLGNTTGRYRIRLGNADHRILIRGESPELTIQPDSSAQVTIPIESKQLSLIGDRFDEQFTLTIFNLTDGSQRKSLAASAIIKPAISFQVARIIGLAMVLGIMLACVTYAFRQFDPAVLSFLSPTETVTATLSPDWVANTATASSADLTATQSALENASATPTLEGGSENDSDNDGLTDLQEEVAGTDPALPDSDFDGLTDGQEVLEFGTQPNNSDTDGDFIPDGQEVNDFFTDPTSRDTDGDGIDDDDEIQAGTDPRVPAPPSITPTDPANPPTDTPTATATVTPSETPTFTPTFTPSPTIEGIVVTLTNTPSATPPATATDLPTATSTNTPTVEPSATSTDIPPTATFTPTATETPSATPTLTPTLTSTPTLTPTVEVEVTPTTQDTVGLVTLQCLNPAVADGVIGDNEWAGSLSLDLLSDIDPTKQGELLIHRDADQIFIALRIAGEADPTGLDIAEIVIDSFGEDGIPDAFD